MTRIKRGRGRRTVAERNELERPVGTEWNGTHRTERDGSKADGHARQRGVDGQANLPLFNLRAIPMVMGLVERRRLGNGWHWHVAGLRCMSGRLSAGWVFKRRESAT